jgi:hypothetical protein
VKLAEAKRRLRAGMTIEAIGHYNPTVTGPREIVAARTTGFTWTAEWRPAPAWTEWPPARRTVDGGPGRITLLMEDGQPMTTLIFPILEAES